MWLLSPWIASRYHLEVGDAWLFRLVALSFVVTSFMVIPLVRLERHLAFHKVAVIESAQAIVFNVAAVYFAWRGRGAYAFVWALLLRSLVGTALANWISPWRVGWRWDWSELIRAHMYFGLPYQGIQVISLLKDSIAPIFIGFLLGTADVGYITWANMIAAYPVLILFVLQRLYMPAFAQVQNHRAQLIALAENVIWATNAIAAPLAILTLVMIVPITTLVIWDEVAGGFCLISISSGAPTCLCPPRRQLWVCSTHWENRKSPFCSHLYGWLVHGLSEHPSVLLYGAIGFALANLVVMFSAFWLYRAAQRQVPFRLLPVIAPVWVIAAISGIFVDLICRQHAPLHILTVVLYGTVGLLVHGSGLYLFYKGKMKAVWSSLRATE